jgi:hypothetical protein
MMICRAIGRAPQTVSVGISFDGIHWSEERFLFVYKRSEGIGRKVLIVIGWLFGVIVIGMGVWKWIGGSGSGNGKMGELKDEEMESFIGRADPGGVTRKRKNLNTRRRIEI